MKCSLYSCLLTVWFPYKSTVLKLTFVNYLISPENFDYNYRVRAVFITCPLSRNSNRSGGYQGEGRRGKVKSASVDNAVSWVWDAFVNYQISPENFDYNYRVRAVFINRMIFSLLMRTVIRDTL